MNYFPARIWLRAPRNTCKCERLWKVSSLRYNLVNNLWHPFAVFCLFFLALHGFIQWITWFYILMKQRLSNDASDWERTSLRRNQELFDVTVNTNAMQATEQFLYYANGSSGLIGVCDPIGPPPDYTYTGICENDTLPIGELSNVNNWSLLRCWSLINFLEFPCRWRDELLTLNLTGSSADCQAFRM